MRDPPSKMWFVLCSHSFRKGCVGFGRALILAAPSATHELLPWPFRKFDPHHRLVSPSFQKQFTFR
jgi:hypothetical protein